MSGKKGSFFYVDIFILIIFLLPAAIFFILYGMDYLIYNPPFFISPDESECLHGSSLYIIIKNFFYVAGVFLISCIYSSYVDLTSLQERGSWTFNNVPVYLAYALGLVSILALAYLGFRLLRKFREGRLITSDIALFIIIVSVGVLLGGVTLGRVQLRSIDYLKGTTITTIFTASC